MNKSHTTAYQKGSPHREKFQFILFQEVLAEGTDIEDVVHHGAAVEHFLVESSVR